MTDLQKIKMIIQEGEGLAVEFKEHFIPRIAEDMAAFANEKGGIIILGVRDDKTIIGEKLTNELKARITSLARNCGPALQVRIRQAEDVIAIEVPQGEEKPYGCGSPGGCSKGSKRKTSVAFLSDAMNVLPIYFSEWTRVSARARG